MLLLLAQSKATAEFPPLQPCCPLIIPVSQSTSSCSDNGVSLRPATTMAPSRAPVAEKAQQEPQLYWFFTGVTAPFSTQSMLSGGAPAGFSNLVIRCFCSAVQGVTPPMN